MGLQAKLPGRRTASKRWLASNKDWEECVCPQHKEHQEDMEEWTKLIKRATMITIIIITIIIIILIKMYKDKKATNHTTSGVCIRMPRVWETK